MFTLTIQTANAAFDGDPRPELARLLRRVAEQLDGMTPFPLDGTRIVDINGNTVGAWGVTP